MYQTQKTLFDHISKVRQKYSAVHHIFNCLLSVWKCGQTRSFVYGIVTYGTTYFTCILSHNMFALQTTRNKKQSHTTVINLSNHLITFLSINGIQIFLSVFWPGLDILQSHILRATFVKFPFLFQRQIIKLTPR